MIIITLVICVEFETSTHIILLRKLFDLCNHTIVKETCKKIPILFAIYYKATISFSYKNTRTLLKISCLLEVNFGSVGVATTRS